jgi:hypothetical protein
VPHPKRLLNPSKKKSTHLNHAVTTNVGTTSAERDAVVAAVVNAVRPSRAKAALHAKVHAKTDAVQKDALKDAKTKHAQPAASDLSVANAWSVLSVPMASAWSVLSVPTATAHSATAAVAKHAVNPETKCAWRQRLN